MNHEEEDDGHHHFHGEVDPHVWLSPLQAMKLAENIKDGLIQVDEAHRADYETNYEQLLGQLHELHLKYEQMTSEATRTDFIVSHQSFGYLARDYGLKQVAIMGLSPEAEPTAQDIMAISKFIKENQVKYILFEELASPQLAKTLANDLKIETLVLNPLEGLTNEQEKGGDDYISVMERNLTTLKKALQ